jgi:type I restriction enzyme M protein
MSSKAENFLTHIKSWEELARLVDHFSRFSAHDWLFRGVTDHTHDLIAKIGRPTSRALKRTGKMPKPERLPYRLADEKIVFESFRTQALSYTLRPPRSRLEWLALAQHFGLPTRLLDWSEGLLVAAWFAVEKAGVKPVDNEAAIWVTYGVPSIDPEDQRDPMTMRAPLVYRPAHVSPRIAAQGSVLMVCPRPTEPVKLPFVRKITIAKFAEFTLKKRLNACGINRHSLFPDMQGLAEHLAWLHKHDYLAGHVGGAAQRVRATPDEEDAPAA